MKHGPPCLPGNLRCECTRAVGGPRSNLVVVILPRTYRVALRRDLRAAWPRPFSIRAWLAEQLGFEFFVFDFPRPALLPSPDQQGLAGNLLGVATLLSALRQISRHSRVSAVFNFSSQPGLARGKKTPEIARPQPASQPALAKLANQSHAGSRLLLSVNWLKKASLPSPARRSRLRTSSSHWSRSTGRSADPGSINLRRRDSFGSRNSHAHTIRWTMLPSHFAPRSGWQRVQRLAVSKLAAFVSRVAPFRHTLQRLRRTSSGTSAVDALCTRAYSCFSVHRLAPRRHPRPGPIAFALFQPLGRPELRWARIDPVEAWSRTKRSPQP